jgi:BirA family biotin operon repressor/biotin-[acetyl-CoA-carboxylase] ligase
MYIIKLDAIDSTNTYIKAMTMTTLPQDYLVVVAESQTAGRGQMGTSWNAETGKNLTASVFKNVSYLKIEQQFYISMVVSLAIHKALKTLKIPQLSIKWPNDILSADKKLCGILIENVIKNNNLQGTIVGFGLNVNQKYFDNLPQASSISLLTGIIYNKDEILSEVLKQLQFYFEMLESRKFHEIKAKYESRLFRRGKPSTFKTNDGIIFLGIINGVTETGLLKVWTEDEITKTFDLKEVTLMY